MPRRAQELSTVQALALVEDRVALAEQERAVGWALLATVEVSATVVLGQAC